MKNTKRFQHFRELRDTLKPMTGKQRLEHIWSYYKLHMAIGLLLVMMLVGVGVMISNAGTQILLSGVVANVDISDAGYMYLTEGCFRHLGGNDNRQKVEMINPQFQDIYTSMNFDNNYNSAMSAVTKAGAQTLDYLILDETALTIYMNEEILMDLREFFTEAELQELDSQENLIRIRNPETGEEIPVAVKINHWAFVQDCLSGAEDVYFSLAVNTPRPEACRVFWNYLQAWESKK